MGRPRKEVDEDLVFELAVKGWTNKEIAAECGCSHDTIERNYAAAIKAGHAVRNGKLRAKQVELALSGNATMLIWLGKNLLGQSEKFEIKGEATVKEAIEEIKQIQGGRLAKYFVSAHERNDANDQ